MTPSDRIDALAEAYFDRLHEADATEPYREQADWTQEKHRRAVRSLLLLQMEFDEARFDRPMPQAWHDAKRRLAG